MGHGHGHGRRDYGRTFFLAVTLNLLLVAAEFGYGWYIGSLALMADAGHNVSDVAGLALAWIAEALKGRPPTSRRTYGFHKTTILAALASAVLLLVAMGALALEAVQRFSQPQPVPGVPLIAVALVATAVNAATAWLFVAGSKEDLNIRGAFLHMAADAGVSVGVVIGGAVILATQWQWVDPVLTLAIVAVVVLSTWDLFRDSLALAIDAVPPGIDPAEVQRYLLSLDGVTGLHDLHIWGISTRDTALTVHLVMPDGAPGDEFLKETAGGLHDRFGIVHPTIQVERECDGGCVLESESRV